MATYKIQYTSGSATATTDLGDAVMGIRNDAASTQLNPTNLAYGFYAVDASGRLFVTGNLGITGSVSVTASSNTDNETFVSSGTKGSVAFALASSTVLTYSGSAMRPLQVDLNGNLRITATASWPVTLAATTVTAVQNGTVWGVTSSAMTANQNGVIWGVTSSAMTANQNGVVWGVTASAVTASANVDSDTYAVSTTRGRMAMGLASATVLAYAGSAIRPFQMDLNGNIRVTATASWPVTIAATTVTASQNGTVWGVTASAVSARVSAEGMEAHGAAGTTNPVRLGVKAAAFNKDFSSASNITAGDASAVNWYGTRTGIPFMLGGGPDMQTVWIQPTAASSDCKLVDVAAGTKIVVLGAGVSLASTATTGVAFRMGFPSASGATGLDAVATSTAGNLTANVPILAHANIPAGGGITRGDAGGIIAVGGDGYDVFANWTAPSNGRLDIWLSYIRVPS